MSRASSLAGFEVTLIGRFWVTPEVNTVPDPTARENIEAAHCRGILVVKALMDEVRLEEGGVIVHMRKGAGKGTKH